MDQNQNDNFFDPNRPQPEGQRPLPGEEPVIMPGGARVYSAEPVPPPPPYTAPTPPSPYATPPGTVVPPKSNTGRNIWLIVALVLLVLCCCCLVSVLLMYYVFGDMILETIEDASLLVRLFV